MVMLTDKASCDEIIRRALALDPELVDKSASNALGEITLPDGRVVNAHVVHAADAVITDGEYVVTIKREGEPGKGLPALPGGFKDPALHGGAENLARAAMREAAEEVSMQLSGGKPIGKRMIDRPHDIRVCAGNGLFKKYGIADGDVFLVTTQAVRFDLPNVKDAYMKAGDDAVKGSAKPQKISEITPEFFGIRDHYDMLVEAVPEAFGRTRAKQWTATLTDNTEPYLGV